MKKTLFFFALTMLLLSATKLQAQLGFHVGYAPQTYAISGQATDGVTALPRLSHGFYGGIHYHRDIVSKFGFTAALQVRMNSSTVNETDFTTQNSQFLADLPLLLNYGFSLGHDLTLGIFAGPMLSYGISYSYKKTNAETYEVEETHNRYSKSESSDYALKRFEVAAEGGLFFKFRSYMIFGGYRMGINDLDKIGGCATRPKGFFVGLSIN